MTLGSSAGREAVRPHAREGRAPRGSWGPGVPNSRPSTTPTPFLPWWLPVALVLVAVPFLRPNIFGESLSPVGFVIVCLAAAAALLRRPGREAGGVLSGGGALDPGRLLIGALALGYLWLLLRSAAVDPGPRAVAAMQSMFLTVGSLVAITVVCHESRERLALARGFVVMVAVVCASYVLSVLVWAVGGVGAGELIAVPVSTWGAQPVYFPFTITVETQPFFGLSLPRLNGFGREPGWMSMYCAIAYFLADMVGLRDRRLKLLLLVGLLGCVSTAGFGVFVVTWAYHRFLRDRGGISLANYLRQVGGVGVLALALWLAVAAPVLGLAAKSDQNATSLNDREVATDAGVRALFENPLGGDDTAHGGINLVADIAISGLPFVLLVCAGLLLTFRSKPTQYGNAVAVVVLLTMLTSQPAKDSTWAFGLVVLACALRRPDRAPGSVAGDGPAPPRPNPAPPERMRT